MLLGGVLTREEASYDVYVKVGVDHLGMDAFGTAVAHFVERTNAVELKRRLEANGKIVRVEKSIVRLPEAALPVWFSDYELPPESHKDAPPAIARRESSDGKGGEEPWWRKVLGG